MWRWRKSKDKQFSFQTLREEISILDLAALKSAAQFIGILKRYNEHILCQITACGKWTRSHQKRAPGILFMFRAQRKAGTEWMDFQSIWKVINAQSMP